MSSRSGSASGSYGHSARRDNMSVSSNHSSRSERATHHSANPAVESAVTRLLVSIKQLLEALTLWSQQMMDELRVSDVYVRLGNDFNDAVAEFSACNIDMSELLRVPDDLRHVLEQCLAEDATPSNLEIYLPTVRQIITGLLHGLKAKQNLYRKLPESRQRPVEGAPEGSDSGRSSRTEKSSHKREMGHRTRPSHPSFDEDGPGSDGMRKAPASKKREPSSLSTSTSAGDEPSTGISPYVSSDPEVPPPSHQASSTGTRLQGHRRSPHTGLPSSSDPIPIDKASQLESYPFPTSLTQERIVMQSRPSPPLSQPSSPSSHVVPSSVQRYSLSDRPVPSSSLRNYSVGTELGENENDADVISPLPSNISPPVRESLMATKLERRASKRFSTYNITKMTEKTSSQKKPTRSNSNRRSLAASSALTSSELEMLTEEDEDAEENARREEAPPPLPEKNLDSISPGFQSNIPQSVVNGRIDLPPDTTLTPPGKITVFLQVRQEVKKVHVEPGLSFSSLRVLFVDKFAYNPGMDNFPAIYIRDPSSGLLYELEDTGEVRQNCLLSLNIEPLDQLKQHIDLQVTSLSQDLKDLRKIITNNERHVSYMGDISLQPLAASTPAMPRPTDHQFQRIGRRISHVVTDMSPLRSPFFPSGGSGSSSQLQMSVQPHVHAQMTGQSLQPQMTGGSVLSEYSNRVVTDLKTQFDEVQNLRRDLGVMRQLFTEFVTQNKDSLRTLRTQTQAVKDLANMKVGGARAYIDSGKQKLDLRSQNALTDVEKLQDTVENIKDDVVKRHVTPKAQLFRNMKKDIDSTKIELESLKEHINTIKPMWKKTWEEELQNIVEEQQFLTHQEEFLNDLLEDHKAVVVVYEQVDKIITLRGNAVGGTAGRTRAFRPPPPDEGHEGLSTVMMEIRGAAIDPERRLKAIEANQRNREKDLASRSDDLQVEISDFVGQKKLRMTGGAEETERVRQHKSDMTIKAMFSGGGSAPRSPTG